MEDRKIIQLFWIRDTKAIEETDAKYGEYCKTIANNILGNFSDAEECVNDTYLHVWNTIPPNRPPLFSAFIGKITRNLSIDRLRYKFANKRREGELALAIEELRECVSGNEDVENTYSRRECIQEINRFLDTLPKKKCDIFLCRYWYVLSISEIAKRFHISETNVSVMLSRIRTALKEYLEERGYKI